MSFRHTAITEFIYQTHDDPDAVNRIQAVLNRFGDFVWYGRGMWSDVGYFHGIFSDLDGQETKDHEKEITDTIFKETGVRIKIVYE